MQGPINAAHAMALESSQVPLKLNVVSVVAVVCRPNNSVMLYSRALALHVMVKDLLSKLVFLVRVKVLSTNR